MTIVVRHVLGGCLAGFMLVAAPFAQAQQPLAPDAGTHADLYAKVRVAGFTAPVDIRQSGSKTRVDLTAGGVMQSYIGDRDKGVLISMIATGQNHLALVFPLDHAEGIVPLPLDLSVLAKQASLKVVGASLVNGRPCRLIEFANYLSQSGMICASADNIVLQMTKRGQKDPLFQVLELTVARQDPKWFRPPPEYQVAVVPAIGGASASGSGNMIEQPQPPSVKIKPPPEK